MLSDIASKLSLCDLAHFRLACKTYCNIRPAHTLTHRITIEHDADWETRSKKIKEVCPAVTVALAVKGTANLVQLLEDPLCDVVVCALRPALMSRWSLEPPQVVYDKAYDFLNLMNQVQGLHDKAELSGRLELQLRVRSDHVQMQEIKHVIKSLGPVIVELRVLERLDSCAKQLFPLENVRIVAFSLPGQANRRMTQLQDAITSLPSLQSIQVYTQTAKSAELLLCFLEVLYGLPHITSLRVVTGGCAIGLQARSLLHIVDLELGDEVYLSALPAALRQLHMQSLHVGDIHATLFLQMDQSRRPFDLIVDHFTISALSRLPASLQGLILKQPLEQDNSGWRDFMQCECVFARLTNLRMLVLGDFLSQFLAYAIRDLPFMKLHTLGICLKSALVAAEEQHFDDGKLLFTPFDFPKSFPALEVVKVYASADELAVPAILHCGSFLGNSVRSKLWNLTCHYPQHLLHLVAFPASCSFTSKPGNHPAV